MKCTHLTNSKTTHFGEGKTVLCCKGQILELFVNLQTIIFNKTKLQALPTSVRVAEALQSHCLIPGVRSKPLKKWRRGGVLWLGCWADAAVALAASRDGKWDKNTGVTLPSFRAIRGFCGQSHTENTRIRHNWVPSVLTLAVNSHSPSVSSKETQSRAETISSRLSKVSSKVVVDVKLKQHGDWSDALFWEQNEKHYASESSETLSNLLNYSNDRVPCSSAL